jgi:hypothetical protein
MSTPRIPLDHYPTPPALAAACIAALPDDHTPRRILDLGAGAGAWGQAARRRWPDAQITGIEIRDTPRPESYDRWIVGDAIAVELDPADLVIGNPPFSIARPLVERAIGALAADGMVAMLLRLSFLEPTEDRAPLLARWPIWRQVTIAPRPRFNPESTRNDSTAPALFFWRPGAPPHPRPIEGMRWNDPSRQRRSRGGEGQQ